MENLLALFAGFGERLSVCLRQEEREDGGGEGEEGEHGGWQQGGDVRQQADGRREDLKIVMCG